MGGVHTSLEKLSTVQSESNSTLLNLPRSLKPPVSQVAMRFHFNFIWFKFQNILKDVGNLQTGKAKTGKCSYYPGKCHPPNPPNGGQAAKGSKSTPVALEPIPHACPGARRIQRQGLSML